MKNILANGGASMRKAVDLAKTSLGSITGLSEAVVKHAKTVKKMASIAVIGSALSACGWGWSGWGWSEWGGWSNTPDNLKAQLQSVSCDTLTWQEAIVTANFNPETNIASISIPEDQSVVCAFESMDPDDSAAPQFRIAGTNNIQAVEIGEEDWTALCRLSSVTTNTRGRFTTQAFLEDSAGEETIVNLEVTFIPEVNSETMIPNPIVQNASQESVTVQIGVPTDPDFEITGLTWIELWSQRIVFTSADWEEVITRSIPDSNIVRQLTFTQLSANTRYTLEHFVGALNGADDEYQEEVSNSVSFTTENYLPVASGLIDQGTGESRLYVNQEDEILSWNLGITSNDGNTITDVDVTFNEADIPEGFTFSINSLTGDFTLTPTQEWFFGMIEVPIMLRDTASLNPNNATTIQTLRVQYTEQPNDAPISIGNIEWNSVVGVIGRDELIFTQMADDQNATSENDVSVEWVVLNSENQEVTSSVNATRNSQNKFEIQIDPAILEHGNYTLQTVTTGVLLDGYEVLDGQVASNIPVTRRINFEIQTEPESITLSNNEIEAWSSAGTVIGQLTTVDPDQSGGIFMYEISWDDPLLWAFNIQTLNGIDRLVSTNQLPQFGSHSAGLNISVTDEDGNILEQDEDIDINDTTAPSFVSIKNATPSVQEWTNATFTFEASEPLTPVNLNVSIDDGNGNSNGLLVGQIVFNEDNTAVSYTHLTLPTIYSV